MPERVGDLEIGQDLAFQRGEWRVQRIVRAVLAVLLTAGLLGVFGNGPLAHATTEAGGLAVEHDRIIRKRSVFELRVTAAPEAIGPDGAAIRVSRGLLDRFAVQGIVPDPAAQQVGDHRVVYRMEVADQAASAEVVFDLEPNDPGGFAGGVGLVDGPEVAISGFVLP